MTAPGPRAPAPRASDVALVALGGAVGSLGRAGVAELLGHPAGAWAWSTVLVNVVGCFALSLLWTVVGQPTVGARRLRLLVGTGLLGGFTTFSTFAFDVERISAGGRTGVAAAYALVGVLSILAATVLGWLAGRRLGSLR